MVRTQSASILRGALEGKYSTGRAGRRIYQSTSTISRNIQGFKPIKRARKLLYRMTRAGSMIPQEALGR